MNAAEVISNLKARGVELWREGDVLRYRARLGALTDKEKAILKMHKPAILKALAAGPDNLIAVATSAPVAPPCAFTAVSTANRQAMPQVAAAIDQLRSLFGPVRVIFASEGGKEMGREPPPGVKPVITGAGAPKRTIRKESRS